MHFPTVEYIDWFRENWHDLDYDLASSGVHSVNLKEPNILIDDLDLGKTLFYGHPRLVELINDIYGAEKNEVLITSGATHANYLACTLLLSEGDEVIVERPVYTPLLDLVVACKAKVVFLERRFEDGYQLNVERLSEMMSKNTKMVMFTNLHNPSGVMMDKETLRSIGELADDNQTYVLSDEVYRDFMFQDAPPTLSSFTRFGITTCSLTKFYGVGSLRVGWTLCDSELTHKLRKLNDYVLVTNSCAGEVLGASILEKRDWFVDRARTLISNNYPIVKKWVDERDELDWLPPRYGVMAFLRAKKDLNSMKFVQLLRNKYRTMVSPGRFFDCENHIRIGFGGDTEMLKSGLENVGLALDEIP